VQTNPLDESSYNVRAVRTLRSGLTSVHIHCEGEGEREGRRVRGEGRERRLREERGLLRYERKRERIW
jgi:hypothetical protein